MNVPHDALYWTFYWLGFTFFALAPIALVLLLTGWVRRLLPVAAMILETVFHLHRHGR